MGQAWLCKPTRWLDGNHWNRRTDAGLCNRAGEVALRSVKPGVAVRLVSQRGNLLVTARSVQTDVVLCNQSGEAALRCVKPGVAVRLVGQRGNYWNRRTAVKRIFDGSRLVQLFDSLARWEPIGNCSICSNCSGALQSGW